MKTSMKDKVKVQSVLAPATVTATGNTSGVNVADFGSLMFLVHAGAMVFDGSNYLDLIVQESDDDSTYTTCDDDAIYNAEDGDNGIAKKLDDTTDQNSVHVIHYRGNKKYARIRMVETGTVSCPIGVTAVAGDPELMPPL